MGEKQQVDLVSTASAALVRNTQKWSSGGKWGFSCWVAGTGVQGEGTGGAQHQNDQSTQFRFTFLKRLFRVGLAQRQGGEQDCCSLTEHGHLLTWSGLEHSHSPWNLDPKWRDGLHMRCGDLTDIWNFLF